MSIYKINSNHPWQTMWQELGKLNNEFSKVFGKHFRSRGTEFPAINLWANSDKALLVTELPGVNQNDIDITVAGNVLTLKGKRETNISQDIINNENQNLGTDNYEYSRKERFSGSFARTIELPFKVDNNKVEASFNCGILKIGLPRLEADKPRRIPVTSA